MQMSFERDLRERGPFINHASAREAAREKIGEGGKKKERKKRKKKECRCCSVTRRPAAER
jgi:hypothetical protein